MTDLVTLANQEYLNNALIDGNFAAVNAGWTPATDAVVSYISATQVLVTADDLTSKISVGMKWRMEQSAADKYFIVDAISVAAGNTTVTLDGLGDYTVANSAISNVYYSGLHAPYGWVTNLITKVIEIGDWNMDATGSVAIAHGVADHLKIRSFEALIRDDTSVAVYKLDAGPPSAVLGYYDIVTSTTITLVRVAGQGFDAVGYDSTSFNRGWLTIVYEA